jgi:predicted enzyme related to lactoylglutathione lyase
MKTKPLIILVLAISFFFGFAFNAILTAQDNKPTTMKRVTGIGGIFFKCKDPKKVTEWYQKHLGLTTNPYGATFEWYESPDSTKKAQTQWTPFAEKAKDFTEDFMINYRVANLTELVEQLKKEGVTILDKIETYDYGKFVHIVDLEGRKIELWEPND